MALDLSVSSSQSEEWRIEKDTETKTGKTDLASPSSEINMLLKPIGHQPGLDLSRVLGSSFGSSFYTKNLQQTQSSAFQMLTPLQIPAQPTFGPNIFPLLANSWLQNPRTFAEYQKLMSESILKSSISQKSPVLSVSEVPPMQQVSAGISESVVSPPSAKRTAEKPSKNLQKVQKPKKPRKSAKNLGKYCDIANSVASNYHLKKESNSFYSQNHILSEARCNQTESNSNQEPSTSTRCQENLTSDLEIIGDQPLDLSLKSENYSSSSIRGHGGHNSSIPLDLTAPLRVPYGDQPLDCSMTSAGVDFDGKQVGTLGEGGIGGDADDERGSPVLDVSNHEVIGYADSAKMPRSRKECRKGPGTARNLKSAKLWELLLWLLSRPEQYSGVIQWRNKSIGFFKLLNDEYLLDIYNDYKDSIPGRAPSNKKILYSSITRALRHYYWNSTLHPTPKRKTYQFGPNATGWQKGVEREHALQSLYQWEQIKSIKCLGNPSLRQVHSKYAKDLTGFSDEEQNDVITTSSSSTSTSRSDIESFVANYNSILSSPLANQIYLSNLTSLSTVNSLNSSETRSSGASATIESKQNVSLLNKSPSTSTNISNEPVQNGENQVEQEGELTLEAPGLLNSESQAVSKSVMILHEDNSPIMENSSMTIESAENSSITA